MVSYNLAEPFEDEDSASDGEEYSGAQLFTGRRWFKDELRKFRKLKEVPVEPLDHEMALDVARHSAGESIRHPVSPVTSRQNKASCSLSSVELLRRREANLAGTGHFSCAQQCHLGCHSALLPTKPARLVDNMQSRAYIGQFSQDGTLFIAAFMEEGQVRIYDVDHDWRVKKDVLARTIRWTVTDTAMSPDQRFLIYATIAPTVNLVDLSSSEGQRSVANVTDVHHELDFSIVTGPTTYQRYRSEFGIWSLQWSSNGNEIIAGTGGRDKSQSLRVYDVEQGKCTVRVEGHDDDVNAVCFAEPDDPNVILTGSDDNLCKFWDRRQLGVNSRSAKPAGVFVGHTEGVTHIDSKGDGRYFISNSKDQTIKLWDMRAAMSDAEYKTIRPTISRLFDWDYRSRFYPGDGYEITHDHDCSVKTYRGHSVLWTLIRAYFSPAASTGQRYIYSGSAADNSVYIYDVLSGRVVDRLSYHKAAVRDCHWHPHLPLLVSTSFDGSVCCWDPIGTTNPQQRLPDPGNDKYGYY